VYRITQQAYNNMAAAYKTQMLLTSKVKLAANATSGRHPFEMFNIQSASFKKFIEVGGDLLGAAYDPEMAAFYNYVYDTIDYPVAKGNYDGFYQFNYGNLGVKRRNNWVVNMKGLTNELWGTEIYVDANRYGRYQSYGALEVLYNGDTTATGYPGNGGKGWDWNMAPGATTVHLPYTELQAKNDVSSEYQANGFAGSLSLGRHGIFAIDFLENGGTRYTANNLKFRKSVFTFDTVFVCLGSGISCSNGVSKTATNLFQAVFPVASSNPAIYVNSTAPVTANNYDNTLSTAGSSAWLVTGETTGFYIPKGGGDITISRGMQTTPVNTTKTGSPTATANYSKAFINHGTAPAGATYQYVMVPGTTPQQMQTLATSFEAAQVFQVLSQTDTQHIVKYLPDSLTAYAFFTGNSNVNIGHVKSISGQALVGIQEKGDTLLVTIDNPDLNTVADAATGWQSTSNTVYLQLNGRWKTISNPNSAKITTDGTSVTAGFSLVNGFSATLKLIPDTSETVITSVCEATVTDRVIIYPNPVSDQLNIRVDKPEPGATLQLINATGVVIRDVRIRHQAYTLPLNKVATGIYFVRVRNGQVITTRKIIKQ